MAGEGYAELDAMIAKVKKVGVLPELVAERAAVAVQAELRRSAASGKSPDGTPWAPTKEGKRALLNAPGAIEVKPSGTLITARLVGTETGSQKVQAIQHYGTKRIPARPMLPVAGGGIPQGVSKVIAQIATETFLEAVQ
jgi:hypothetical protein